MSDTLRSAIAQLAGQSPTLLVYLAAIILGAIYTRIHAKSALLLISGAVLMLLTSIGSTIAYTTITVSGPDGGAPEDIHSLMTMTSVISSFAYATGLSLFVAAALCGRR